MNEPKISKFPTELFGFTFTNHSEEAISALKHQYCPFLDRECKKPRKSEPHIKIGVCSLGYKGEFLPKATPIIVCPHRFESDIIFDTLKALYFPKWKEVKWVKEVSIGVGGSVDFVATHYWNETIKDFLCVEFQAAGTTGSPWQAVLDFKQNRSYLLDNYGYGINWANEFSKTMMQQVYKKGKIVASWKQKIVFVFQDVGLDYLRSACDTSSLRAANDDDPVHFCTFSLVWKGSYWGFEFAENVSTDVEGVNRMLGGVLEENYPNISEFKDNIARKLKL